MFKAVNLCKYILQSFVPDLRVVSGRAFGCIYQVCMRCVCGWLGRSGGGSTIINGLSLSWEL